MDVNDEREAENDHFGWVLNLQNNLTMWGAKFGLCGLDIVATFAKLYRKKLLRVGIKPPWTSFI